MESELLSMLPVIRGKPPTEKSAGVGFWKELEAVKIEWKMFLASFVVPALFLHFLFERAAVEQSQERSCFCGRARQLAVCAGHG
jgi:hypothetical protein